MAVPKVLGLLSKAACLKLAKHRPHSTGVWTTILRFTCSNFHQCEAAVYYGFNSGPR